MAALNKIHPKNVGGSLFVDTTCIDCGTCYHLAPEVFEEAEDENSFVKAQPQSVQEWVSAKQALISCPTNSIGVHSPPSEFKEAQLGLPLLISENVYYCGYTARESFGATTYLIRRMAGNVLIDSPRFNSVLAKELSALGGVDLMILTHQDDVADHEEWARHFKCKRVIDRREVTMATAAVEQVLDIPDSYRLDSELVLVSVPGHTPGHLAILYKDEYLFSGDHLFFDPSSKKLTASRNVCWYDWKEQISSVHKLLHYKFEWVLPGHGGWGRFKDTRSELIDLVERMKRQ